MTRNRASAKKAGTAFETMITKYLAEKINPRIERRRLNGAKDRGDIAGVYHLDQYPVTIECKNHARLSLPDWHAQATTAAKHNHSQLPVVIHKRHGNANPEAQWVTMTLETFARLLNPTPTTTREPVTDPAVYN